MSQVLLMILYGRGSSGQTGLLTVTALLQLLMTMIASTITILKLTTKMSNPGNLRPRGDALRSSKTFQLWKYGLVVFPLGSILPWPCHPCQLWPSRRSLSLKEQVTKGTRSQESHLHSCLRSPHLCLGWCLPFLRQERVLWILETSYIF